MTLQDDIAAAVVLLCDAKQEPDNVHALITALCNKARIEGHMAGLDRAQELVTKHFGKALGRAA